MKDRGERKNTIRFQSKKECREERALKEQEEMVDRRTNNSREEEGTREKQTRTGRKHTDEKKERTEKEREGR